MMIKDLTQIKKYISNSYDLIKELYIELDNIIHLENNDHSRLTYLYCEVELLKNITWAIQRIERNVNNVDQLKSWVEIFNEVNYIHDIVSDFSPVEEISIHDDVPSMEDLITDMENTFHKERIEKIFQYFDKILGLYMMG